MFFGCILFNGCGHYSICKKTDTISSKFVLTNNVEAMAKHLTKRVKGTTFVVYSVKPGNNLWNLAEKYGYSIHTLIGTNPQLKTYNIKVNQKILIPSSSGTLHLIQKKDTWGKIAKRYDIDINTLKSKNCGVLELINGEYIFVPGRRPSIDLMNKKMRKEYKYRLHSLFRSPLSSRLCVHYSSIFGKRVHPITGKVSFHKGVDIVVPSGTCVTAAADGVVIVASHNVGHYGTAIFIDHKNGYITHYGHLSSINVKLGQRVRQGQLIAKSGKSGKVTGPHLHFTIKKGNTAVDPLYFI